jgi:hypothetical protein
LYLVYVCWVDWACESAEEDGAGWEGGGDRVSVETGAGLAIGLQTVQEQWINISRGLTIAHQMALRILSKQEL